MTRFVIRRVLQAMLTIFGVMVVTFLLFRVVSGDIAAAHTGAKATEQAKAAWRHRHGYDRPLLLNVHGRISIADNTEGEGVLLVLDAEGGKAADSLALLPSDKPDEAKSVLKGRFVTGLDMDTPIIAAVGRSQFNGKILIKTADGRALTVDVDGVRTVRDLLDRINGSPGNSDGMVLARIVNPTIGQAFDSQFFHYLAKAITFQTRSLKDNQKLTDTIVARAPKSLALTVPAMALGWMVAMVISCFVAYYRDTWIDRAGVFISVLGMCVPFLAFMIFGQWFMFMIAPRHAYGLAFRANIYVPISIMVVAGLGGSVRFYRTVILDEINRDYVRTAKAKGVSLTAILFKHVLKNCMLPILTNLVMAIPFLIMGSLLVERYFGIPGLGDLMLSSINGRDEPIMSGLVFLSTLVYTAGLLVTDLSYAMFDPRVRLR